MRNPANVKFTKGKKIKEVEKALGNERAPTVPVPSVPCTEEEWLKASVINAIGDGLVLLTMDGKITAVNPAFEKMTGCEKSEVVGKDAADVVQKLIKSEDMEKAMRGFRTALKGKVPTSRNLTLVTKDGREVSIISTTSFMEDSEGKPSTMILVFKDITEHKKIDKKLRLFSQSVESAIDGIAMGSLEGKIIYANEAFVRMFGYSREELIRKEIAFIYPEDQVPKLEEALKATLEGGWTGELVAKRKDGKLFPMMVSSSRVLDDEGKVIAHMASHRDVTKRKRAEEERLKATADRQRIEQLEKFAKIAVGRELKMVELKERMKALESKLKEEITENG